MRIILRLVLSRIIEWRVKDVYIRNFNNRRSTKLIILQEIVIVLRILMCVTMNCARIARPYKRD